MANSRTPNETPQTSFRLRPQVIADLDESAELLTAQTGVRHTRTDAVAYAARLSIQTLKKAAKKTR